MPSELSPALRTYISENHGNSNFASYFLQLSNSTNGSHVIGLYISMNLYFGYGLGLDSGVGNAFCSFDLRPMSGGDVERRTL